MRRRTVLLAGVALVMLLLVYPFNVTVIPEWNVKVVDEGGRPVPGAYILLFATQWTLDFHHEEAVCTDSNGQAYFPRETVRASVVTRVLKWVSRLGPHSSLGPDAKVGVEALGYGDMPGDTITTDWNGSAGRVNSQLSFHKCAEGLTGYHCNFNYKYFFDVNSSARKMAACQAAPGRRFAVPAY